MQRKDARSSTPTTSRAICRTTLNYQQKGATTARARPIYRSAPRRRYYPSARRLLVSVKRLYDAFKQLKNDNDFSVCGRADEAHTRDLPPCAEQSNKYAAVVVPARTRSRTSHRC